MRNTIIPGSAARAEAGRPWWHGGYFHGGYHYAGGARVYEDVHVNEFYRGHPSVYHGRDFVAPPEHGGYYGHDSRDQHSRHDQHDQRDGHDDTKSMTAPGARIPQRS